MTIDPQEAKKGLELIKEAQVAEQDMGSREVGWLLVIWGAVWLVGFLASHFAPVSWLLWMWLLLLTAGSAASAVIGVRLGQQVQYTQTGPKLGLFYTALFGFGLLWLYLAQPGAWQHVAVLAISVVGFAVVASGILLQRHTLVVAGIAGTALAVLAYLFLLPYFGLIVGLAGGGGMMVSGWRLRGEGRDRE